METNHSLPKSGRRQFLVAAGAAVVHLCVGGCIRRLDVAPPSMEGGKLVFLYTRHPELAEVGGVAAAGPVTLGDYKGNLYVRRLAEDQAVVLGARCPHLGCDVEWEAERNEFVCPCHKSIFDAEGELTKGPAKRGLPAWLAEIRPDGIYLSLDATPLRE